MEKLQSLILDDCNIMSVEKDALNNLLNLKILSIQRNRFTTLPSNIMIPSLQSLSFNGQKPDGKTSISIGKSEKYMLWKIVKLETQPIFVSNVSLDFIYLVRTKPILDGKYTLDTSKRDT